MDWHWHFFILTTCLLHMTSAAGVVGIDLGSEFMKMAIVKHGSSSAVDIVLNEQTQRKTITYIGFRGDERYFGEDAFQLHTRFPTNMVTYLTHWAGQKFDDAQAKQEELMFRFKFERSERDTVDVQVTPDAKYSAEELLAMLLTYVKELSSKHAEMPITDCVIAIPASYTLRQRQALASAAEVAGLNLYSFVHHTVAAALQYAISRRGFPEETNLMIFDMGAAKLEVGIFTFRPAVNASKDILGHMQVRSIQSAAIGGRHFDALIARHIADQFLKSSGKDVLAMATADGAKATAKLMRTAKKTKETLSANKDAPAPVEGIYDERDFNTVVKREEFEAMADPLAVRAIDIVKKALEEAGLSAEQLHVCELMGGGTRVPIVQDRLVELVGKSLSKTLNTDEAVAMAAAFQAAKQSGLFRVKTFLTDEPSYINISFALSADENVPKPARRPLFKSGDNSTSKTVTIFRSKTDFNITIYGERADGTIEPIDEYALVNVTQAFKKMGLFGENVHNESSHRLEVRFTWNTKGFVDCDGATAKFDEVLNATKKVKRKVVKVEENASAAATNASETDDDDDDDNAAENAQQKTEAPKAADKSEEGTDGEAPNTGAAEGESTDSDTNNTTNTTANDTNTTEELYDIVNTTTTKRHHEKITVVTRPIMLPLPLTPEDVKAAQHTLVELKERDEAKQRKSHAKNELETTIYNTKYDKFFDVEELKPFYNATEEEAIRNLLSETEEWLEGDGYDATVEEYTEKLTNITSLTEAIWAKKLLEDAKKKVTKDTDTKAKKRKPKKKKAGKKSDKDDDDDDDNEDDDDDSTGRREEL